MKIRRLLATLIFIQTSYIATPQAQGAQTQAKPRPKPSQARSATRPRASQPAPVPPAITSEQAFYYWVAAYGSPQDVVDRYAREFDEHNYRQAMADEFERNHYRTAIAAKIARNVASLSSKDRFSYVSSPDQHKGAGFGEYNFVTQAFPIKRPDTGFDYLRYNSGFQINPFDLSHSVNARDYAWSLPMDEARGKAFLANHPGRQLLLRFSYSLTAHKRDVHNSRFYLTPFIHSVEVFADLNLTRVIATLVKSQSPGAWRDANSLEPGTKTIYYKTQYRSWRGEALTPSKGGELPSKDDAGYYRVLDFDGTTARVKDYYITGELEMEGRFLPLCRDEDQELCPDGDFTWYYQNGLKRQEASFRDGEELAKCGDYARLWDDTGRCKQRGRAECQCVDQVHH